MLIIKAIYNCNKLNSNLLKIVIKLLRKITTLLKEICHKIWKPKLNNPETSIKSSRLALLGRLFAEGSAL